MAISEYFLGQLTTISVESDSSGIGSGDDDIISSDIGAIYRSKVELFNSSTKSRLQIYSYLITMSFVLILGYTVMEINNTIKNKI